ncbi:MAG TPA: hypothetical protein P5275_18485 [Saprospiraceae bacterium]|nr:hypothetical protein [Saprospiraceae bacterium]HPG09512.1 hypothetical protein [Saprospiraceae bacterium]HPQ98806.1 hypothetical protein [Saprospiraceae bacterium]HRV86868.1 hypothetical protein [Saprospiraceae bacterium]
MAVTFRVWLGYGLAFLAVLMFTQVLQTPQYNHWLTNVAFQLDMMFTKIYIWLYFILACVVSSTVGIIWSYFNQKQNLMQAFIGVWLAVLVGTSLLVLISQF